jgi:hypothetical protein
VKRWPLPTALAVLFIAAFAVGWSRDHSAAVRVWVASPFVKLQAETAPAAWRPALVAPRGGRTSFQLVVDGGRQVRPAVGVLRGPSGAALPGIASIKRELTVPVTQHSDSVPGGLLGDVPDPLVPVSLTAPKSARQVFWVSITVPRSARPGSYRGSVGAAGRSVEFTLRVVDVSLPPRHALHTWFLNWSNHADDAEGRPDAAPAYTRLLAAYGIGDGTAAGGDTAVGLPPDSLAPDASDATLQRLAQRVAVREARLRARRPAAVPYSYVADEPEPGQLPQVRRWGEQLAREAPGVRQLVTAPPEPALGNSVGAWAMHLDALTPDALSETRSVGAQAWVYSSCCERAGAPTLLLDQDAAGNLAVAPATWQQGATGLLYWSVNDFTGDPYTDPINHDGEADRVANGDGVLLYPGRPLGLRDPNSSLRLELVAAGLQIADEAALLARRGQAREARALIARVVPGTASFVESPAAWQAVERDLLRRLERSR